MTESVSLEDLRRRCRNEGVSIDKINVLKPCWKETARRSPGVKSVLARPDVILRSDGSAVYLDHCMSDESLRLAKTHMARGPVPDKRWQDFCKAHAPL